MTVGADGQAGANTSEERGSESPHGHFSDVGTALCQNFTGGGVWAFSLAVNSAIGLFERKNVDALTIGQGMS